MAMSTFESEVQNHKPSRPCQLVHQSSVDIGSFQTGHVTYTTQIRFKLDYLFHTLSLCTSRLGRGLQSTCDLNSSWVSGEPCQLEDRIKLGHAALVETHVLLLLRCGWLPQPPLHSACSSEPPPGTCISKFPLVTYDYFLFQTGPFFEA